MSEQDTSEQDTAADPWKMVVAASENDVIGRGEQLPWHLRSDLQRFKRMTMGHCLLMGRKTYQSIGRPLPGRQTIVLSRNGLQASDNSGIAALTVVGDISQVTPAVEPGRKVMVVGGAEVYRVALPYCDTLWLTRVLTVVEGDTYLPAIDWAEWYCESRAPCSAGKHDQWATEFQVWKRKSPGQKL